MRFGTRNTAIADMTCHFRKGMFRDRGHRAQVQTAALCRHSFEGTIEVSQMTLYMKLGGRKAVMRAMPRLQARLEQDPCFDLAGFRQEFERSDDLAEFLVFLFGGAPFYDGKPVSALLSPICTCEDVYERFVDHLVAVFFGSRSLAADETDLRELMQRLRPRVLEPKPVAPVLVYSVDPDRRSA
jgi:truncated hemoglobin YjbI